MTKKDITNEAKSLKASPCTTMTNSSSIVQHVLKKTDRAKFKSLKDDFQENMKTNTLE